MVELIRYRATDRRCYDGVLCSDMKKEDDHTKELENRMKRADKTATCTYFPAENKFLIFFEPDPKHSRKMVTGNMHYEKQDALIEAIRVLEGKCEHLKETKETK